MTVGVLALQGAFIEHIEILKELGVETKEIRKRTDFDKTIDGLILPGEYDYGQTAPRNGAV